jgi:formate transporter
MNMAGALFVAGFLCWWSDTFSTNSQKSYAVAQSEARVNVQWSVNFLRGVGCNWFVGLAILMSISAHDHICKIYAIWIPIWIFVALGYQYCVANFFLVPIGMFYGTDFGVGKFINQSVIPVTLGNIVGGAVLNGVIIWFLYGRSETTAVKDNNGNLTGQDRLPS